MPSSESKSSSDVDFDEKKPAGSSESKEALSPKKAAKADAKDGTTDSKDAGDDGADIVSKVIAFFFDDDEFAQTFEQFAETHCHDFDLESEEMKLEYTDIYNQFLELFETKLEAYIASQGSTVKEFYRLVRHAYENDRQSSIVLCSEILVATADFDVFVMMMKQTKESLLLAKR